MITAPQHGQSRTREPITHFSVRRSVTKSFSTFFPLLPIRPRQMLPCIRPCSTLTHSAPVPTTTKNKYLSPPNHLLITKHSPITAQSTVTLTWRMTQSAGLELLSTKRLNEKKGVSTEQLLYPPPTRATTSDAIRALHRAISFYLSFYLSFRGQKLAKASVRF